MDWRWHFNATIFSSSVLNEENKTIVGRSKDRWGDIFASLSFFFWVAHCVTSSERGHTLQHYRNVEGMLNRERAPEQGQPPEGGSVSQWTDASAARNMVPARAMLSA